MPILPNLPFELQEEIFRLAVTESTTTAGRLIQVSKWVRHFIEPILYEVIALVKDDGNGVPAFYPPHIAKRSSDILSFFEEYGRHVRYLCINPPTSLQPKIEIASILKSCLFLKNLMVRTQCSREIIQVVQDYPPNLKCFSAVAGGCHTFLDASKPTYQRLTHLDLLEAHDWETWSAFLTQLPCLTHLALDYMRGTMVHNTLRECKNLQALLLVMEDRSMKEVCREEVDDMWEIHIDEKAVVISVRGLDHWLSSVRGEVDMWALADRVIMERRKNREKRLDVD
ncbi:hypothetical protein BDN72DRAFT_959531 [Pluteus cervinus]|uniref:Uncharacterized protein n=1 Tax=Pluteus cervinus TaxID=181527 RepID=A0ACD3AWV1_9AGAR|nr:hypothetical protein BDN72DRAFT_959531 [Pluteus cervinus]